MIADETEENPIIQPNAVEDADDGEIIDEETVKIEVDPVSDKEEEDDVVQSSNKFDDDGLENIISDEGELCDSDGKAEEKERKSKDKSKKKDKDKKKHKSSKHKKRSRSRSPVRHHRRSPSSNNERQLSPVRNSTREVHGNGRRYQPDKKKSDGVHKELYSNPIVLHNRCHQVIQIGENQASLISDEELRIFIRESLKLEKSIQKLVSKRNELSESMKAIIKSEMRHIRKIHSELPRHMQNVLQFDGNSVFVSQGGPTHGGFSMMPHPPFGMPPFMPPPGMFPVPPPGFPPMGMPPQLPHIPSFSQLSAVSQMPVVQPVANVSDNREPPKSSNENKDWRSTNVKIYSQGQSTPSKRNSDVPTTIQSFSHPPPSHIPPHINNDSRRFGSPLQTENKEVSGNSTPPVQMNSMVFSKPPPSIQGNKLSDFSRPPPQTSSQEKVHHEGGKSPEVSKSMLSSGFRPNPALQHKDGSMLPVQDISKNLSSILTNALKAHVSQVKTSPSPFVSTSPANTQPRDKGPVPSLMSVNTATTFVPNRGISNNTQNRKRPLDEE